MIRLAPPIPRPFASSLRPTSLARASPASPLFPPTRSSTHPTSPRPLAFAFDIDGVLKSGPHVLPSARRALQLLSGANRRRTPIPYVLITNGGGKSERERARDLSRELGVALRPAQIVQAHTVLQSLVPLYRDRPILVVGGPEGPPYDTPRAVMREYGFTDVVTPLDLHAYAPAAWPFTKVDPVHLPHLRKQDFSRISFAAVLVFHDSRDWGRDIQLIIDVLRSHNGVFGTEHPPDRPPAAQMPLYFSHGDLLWGNDHSVVRFGQGAFRLALENVWKHTTGRELESTVFGKPHSLTYDYANALLRDLLLETAPASSSSSSCEKPSGADGPARRTPAQTDAEVQPSVWMVGDNPESDIAGANGYGWSSALVRTGVYRDAQGPPRHEPTIIVDDVEEAVRRALEIEWGV